MSNTNKYDVKRNEIIDCSEKLFVSRGYEDTTVNAILNEVGIAKGTFYYYFESKEEVMDAVIMRFIEEELSAVKKILVRKDLDAFDKLIMSIFNKPKSKNKKIMVEQLYQANNALMKQRTMQLTIEIICPVFAEIIMEGNQNKAFDSTFPLADSQFLVAGLQTLYDLSNLQSSTVNIDTEAIVNSLFRVLKIDEAKVSKEQAMKKITKNMSDSHYCLD